MVAASLLLIISIGMTALVTSIQKEQRKQALLQVLVSQKNRFENAILNPNSWTNTLNNNASMACLSTQTPCTTVTGHSGDYRLSYSPAILRDGTASPGLVFYTFAGADGAIQGFTESGMPCNTFTTAAAGNDVCPIGYRVSWAPHNIAANPMITVYAKMIYNPSDTNPFKTFLNAPATSTITNAKYDAIIDRTATTATKVFTVTYEIIASGLLASNCETAGYGTCSLSATVYDNFPNTRVIVDASDLVDESITPAIRIKNIGKYKCTAKSYAFGTNGSYVRISRSTPLQNYDASTFAANDNYGYSTIIMDAIIDVTVANTDITFQQRCDMHPTSLSDPWIAKCSMGFSGGPYSTSITAQAASLSCILVE